MNKLEKKYLELSLTKLEEILPCSKDILMKIYEASDQFYLVEEDSRNYVYCLFSFPYPESTSKMERIILLVYDNEMIAADCSGLHAGYSEMFFNPSIETCMDQEDDWTYTEYVIMKGMFETNQNDQITEAASEIMLFSNIYVTKSYRRQSIFTTMLDMCRDFALRFSSSDVIYASIVALDPDVACYGPDASDQPYIYSMEQDEPIRQKNMQIMTELGYYPVYLHPEEDNTDGAKLWYAMRMEQCRIIFEKQSEA